MSATIPGRSEIKEEDRWNLSRLYKTEEDWEKDLAKFKALIPGLGSYKGRLAEGYELFKECLDRYFEMEALGERLGVYAFLRWAEDASSSDAQGRQARYTQSAVQASSEVSYLAPEIQAIPDANIAAYLEEPGIKDYRIYLEKLLRYKPHILSPQEEKVMALAGEANQTAQKTFSALTDVDMDFGTIMTPEGEVALSHASYGSLIQHQDRQVREGSFVQFHGHFISHKNTLASLYAGSVNLDVYKARVRNFDSSLQAALFPDNVPVQVYHNLVDTVRQNLPNLHRYYALRARLLKVEPFQLWDNKVSLVSSVKMLTPYPRAAELVAQAVSPLGDEYADNLYKGLVGGWVDKYENKGKRSGAFSAGSFYGDPYILMNYREDDPRDVFTLAHEGGHSMHSWYSSRSNPFPHYDYTIFEAEVASTFNEQLLFTKLMKEAGDPQTKAFLLNKQIDDILATLFRQTMFAEYELKVHELVEQGEALTVDRLRQEYRALLEAYFGPDTSIHEHADIEGLRIPHFYRAFYVYKYATGISAAISLADRVLQGGAGEREDYFRFLRSGGSRFPIESLKLAGVDMSRPEPIVKALERFSSYVDELAKVLS